MAACMLCSEAITNPLCKSCLKEEVKAWLEDKNSITALEVEDFDIIFAGLPMCDSWCIRCNNRIRVCAHCYLKEIHDWLKSINPEMAEEFIESFNYEIRTPFNEEKYGTSLLV
jgi:hypothetical protein